MKNPRPRGPVVLLVSAIVAVALASFTLRSADHSDAPLVSALASADINDLYAFRSPSDPNSLVLVMTTVPFIPPSEVGTASFSSDVLYEFKIDTDGDAVEDYVIQVTFDGPVGNQNLTVYGPALARSEPTTRARLMAEGRRLSGPVSTTAPVVIRGEQMQVFAGVREDPFFLDFEQLSAVLAGQANSFRDPGIDTFAGLNTLAIVVELPVSMIGGATDLGIWATTSTTSG